MRVHRVLNNNLRGARKGAEEEEEKVEEVLRDVSELIVEGEVKSNEVHQGVSLREVKVNKDHPLVSLREAKDPHQRARVETAKELLGAKVEKDKVVLLGTKEVPLKAKVVSQEPQGVLQVVSQEVHPRVVNQGVHPRV